MGGSTRDRDSRTVESLDLVRRAQNGELPALDRLFERYYPRVRKIVRLRLAGSLGPHLDADDVLHEALVRAIRGFDHFEVRDNASLTDWLARIVENCIRELARAGRTLKRDRAREQALEHVRASISSGSLCFEPAAEAPLPDEDAGAREESERLEAALAELPEHYREAIIARHYVGASWEQAAEMLGRPSPDAARMLYGKALLELRKRVGTLG